MPNNYELNGENIQIPEAFKNKAEAIKYALNQGYRTDEEFLILDESEGINEEFLTEYKNTPAGHGDDTDFLALFED